MTRAYARDALVLLGLVALALWLLAADNEAEAAGYSLQSASQFNCTTSDCTPMDLCQPSYNYTKANGYTSICSGGSFTCSEYCAFAGRANSTYNWKITVGKYVNNSTGQVYYMNTYQVDAQGGGGQIGNPCWNEAWSQGSTDPSASHGCEPCGPGKIRDTTGQCVTPSCPSGQQYDFNIDSCRPTCASGSFYYYASASCQPQCPVGDFANKIVWGYVDDNGASIAGGNGIPDIMNGCSVEAVTTCEVDTSGQSPTGLTCFSRYRYDAAVAEDAGSQTTYYTGESPPGDNEEYINPVQISSPVTVGSMSTECMADGTRVVKLYTPADGLIDTKTFPGQCPSVETDGNLPNFGTQAGTQVAFQETTEAVEAVGSKVDLLLEGQDEQDGILTEIQTKLTALGDMFGSSGGGGTGGGEGSGEEPCTNPADCSIDGGALPESIDPTTVYQRQFGDGAGGIKKAIEDAGNIDSNSDLSQALNDLQPVWPTDVPACLAWDIEFINGISFHIEPPCFLWDWLRVMFIALATLSAWGILVGNNGAGSND